MNPARSFGSALTADQYKGLWLYFVAPPIAMLLAAEVYRWMRARSEKASPDRKPLPDYPVEQS